MLTLAQAADMTGALAAYKLALAEERIAELKGRLEEMRQERDRARAGEDAWKAQCEAVTRQIALPAPHDAQTAQQPPDTQPSRFRRDGRWMRATGCLVGAGLLLALSAVALHKERHRRLCVSMGSHTGRDRARRWTVVATTGAANGALSASRIHPAGTCS